MRFLVFIKQVPEVSNIRFDPEKKTLIREGVKNAINPYDRRAISEAVRYRNEKGGEVIVATMGPPQAREALLEALAMGADRAVHVEDHRLAGSDTLVTSRVLAAAARRFEFDVIFCGLHSTDSETGQIPPELGELLGIPCAVSVCGIEYGAYTVRVHCETDEGTTTLDLPLPAVLSTAERLIKPIKVKDVDLSSIPSDKIEILRLEDLNLDPDTVGVSGSPTCVARIEEQVISRKTETWDGSDAGKTAVKILEVIRAKSRKPQPPVVPANTIQGEREFWCWIECCQDRFSPVSLEILSTAAQLASSHGGKVCAVFTGNPLSAHDILLLSAYGADQLYKATSTNPHPDEIVSLLCEKISSLKPFVFLFPATAQGRYLAPRVAARLYLGLIGDCVGLNMDADGRLIQMKPAFGGNIIAPIYTKTFPQLATVRPGALPSYQPRIEDEIPVVAWTFPYNVPHQFKIVEREIDAGIDAARMETSDIVVCVGMGLGMQNASLAYRIADLLSGAVGATRRVVDSGWMQRQFQIGLTGKFIAPRAYLGLGVSGKYNHTIGIRKADTIVAVNRDPNAEIFKMANLGVLGDCVKIAQAMVELLESRGSHH